jgi:hypothetical protein
MRCSISNEPTPNKEEHARMRHASLIRKASLAYGAYCSVAVCATLLFMLCSRQSPLGQNLTLLFLAVFWSGVPLLPLSIYSLKGRGMARIARGVVPLLSLVPALVCLFYPIMNIFVVGGLSRIGIAPLVVLLFAPVTISAILLLLLISRCFPEKTNDQ